MLVCEVQEEKILSGEVIRLHAQHPVWSIRIFLFVWHLFFRLAGKEDPASSVHYWQCLS